MVEQVLDDLALLQLFNEASGKDGGDVKQKKEDDATLVLHKQNKCYKLTYGNFNS